jgi:hypothetical protein
MALFLSGYLKLPFQRFPFGKIFRFCLPLNIFNLPTLLILL